MALLTTGKGFIRDLEHAGTLGIYIPLEGGYEGRYQRRLRASGYETLVLTARGLGDISTYLTGVHGVRPPHLGKKTVGLGASVGYVYYAVPVLTTRLEQISSRSKGLVLWLLEGMILSSQELTYLSTLPSQDSRLKVVVEMGGDRAFRWQSLSDILVAA